MKVLFGIWLVTGGMLGAVVQYMFASSETDEDELSVLTAFWFVIYFYETYRDQINRLGLIIAITSISVIVLPGSLLIIIMVIFNWILQKLWEFFKFIFRRKSKEEEHDAD